MICCGNYAGCELNQHGIAFWAHNILGDSIHCNDGWMLGSLADPQWPVYLWPLQKNKFEW
jgi:hypothetical protein